MNKELLFKLALRKYNSESISKIGFDELIKKFSFIKYRLVEDKTNSTMRVLCITADESYVSIRVNEEKLALPRKDVIKWLINNATIYCGVKEITRNINGTDTKESIAWFTFSSEPKMGDPIEELNADQLISATEGVTA